MNDTTAPRFLRRRIAAAGIAIGLVGAASLLHRAGRWAKLRPAPPAAPPQPPGSRRSAPTDSTLAPSEADGVIRDDARPSVFDDHLPAVSKLDPALLEALQRAATDAEETASSSR